jgi:hypothetical protein
MHNPTRTILILMVLAVGGLTALGFIAYRYTRLLEASGTTPEEAAQRVGVFIKVRQGMRSEIDSWNDGQPHRESLTAVRDRALALHGVDLATYAEVRESYRAWRGGRLRAGTSMAAALEGRREELGRVDLGVYEPLDS